MKLKQLESYLGDVVQFANPKVTSSSSSSSYVSLCSFFGVLLRSWIADEIGSNLPRCGAPPCYLLSFPHEDRYISARILGCKLFRRYRSADLEELSHWNSVLLFGSFCLPLQSLEAHGSRYSFYHWIFSQKACKTGVLVSWWHDLWDLPPNKP